MTLQRGQPWEQGCGWSGEMRVYVCMCMGGSTQIRCGIKGRINMDATRLELWNHSTPAGKLYSGEWRILDQSVRVGEE